MWRSVRVRVTFTAVLALAVVLLVASAVLVGLQRASLTDGIDRNLTLRADDVEALMAETGTTPGVLPQVSERFVQVIGPDGMVVLFTPNLGDESALIFEEDLPFFATTGVPAVDDDRFRVLGRRLSDGGVIYVGTSFDQVDESTSALVTSLGFAWPILLGSLAVIVWWLVGRTLEPVEEIRSEVAGLGARDLERRVPTTGSGDEIDRLAVTMNEMLERLETATEQQQRFVADASHELRSPLTRLRSQIEVELRDGTGDQRVLSDLRDEVNGMQRVIEDLLYLARLDAGEMELRPARVDLDDLVLRELENSSLDSGIRIDASGVALVDVYGDEVRLRRAVSNIIENALRHASSGVSVEVSRDDHWAVVTVRDDGAGVPSEAAEMIFDRFARVDEARSESLGGTGLGLAIAREIAAAHGGTLELANPGEKGAVFEMRLPAMAT